MKLSKMDFLIRVLIMFFLQDWLKELVDIDYHSTIEESEQKNKRDQLKLFSIKYQKKNKPLQQSTSYPPFESNKSPLIDRIKRHKSI